jgi:hypothetical protein
MNKQEAMDLLAREIARVRSMQYIELVTLIDSSQIFEREGPSGCVYQIEIEAFWDNPRESYGNVRVIGSIDDGRLPRSFLPLTIDFIKDPDGHSVGD